MLGIMKNFFSVRYGDNFLCQTAERERKEEKQIGNFHVDRKKLCHDINIQTG
jgi:hypothetical protein